MLFCFCLCYYSPPSLPFWSWCTYRTLLKWDATVDYYRFYYCYHYYYCMSKPATIASCYEWRAHKKVWNESHPASDMICVRYTAPATKHTSDEGCRWQRACRANKQNEPKLVGEQAPYIQTKSLHTFYRLHLRFVVLIGSFNLRASFVGK